MPSVRFADGRTPLHWLLMSPTADSNKLVEFVDSRAFLWNCAKEKAEVAAGGGGCYGALVDGLSKSFSSTPAPAFGGCGMGIAQLPRGKDPKAHKRGAVGDGALSPMVKAGKVRQLPSLGPAADISAAGSIRRNSEPQLSVPAVGGAERAPRRLAPLQNASVARVASPTRREQRLATVAGAGHVLRRATASLGISTEAPAVQPTGARARARSMPTPKALPERPLKALVKRRGQSAQAEAAPKDEPRAAEEPRDGEADALQHIAGVASGVRGDLDRLIKECEAISSERLDVVSSLREIASATRRARAALEPEEEGRPANLGRTPLAAAQQPYSDPVLERARRVAAGAERLCLELGESGEHEAREALSEISSATAQVCEEMGRFKEQSWAAGVLSSVPGKGEAPLEEVLVANAGALEEEVSEDAEPEAASMNARAGAPMLERVQGLPDLEELLACSSDEGHSEKELARMQTAFKRFKVPDSGDLHKGDLCGLLQYLGHVMIAPDEVQKIANGVSSFDYLDYEEFLDFMAKYMPYEQEKFRVVFARYDEEGQGEMSVKGLRKLLAQFGFMPLHAMIREAVAVVDADCNGRLNFEELMMLLAVYRRAEGFTQDEVSNFRRIFDLFSKGEEAPMQLLPPEALSDAMVQAFGIHVHGFAEKMQDQLKRGQGLQKSALAGNKGGKPASLTFAEFLIYARKIREAVYDKLTNDYPAWANLKCSNMGASNKGGVAARMKGDTTMEFERSDLDHSGGISEFELRRAMEKCGYTPLSQNIKEVLMEVLGGDLGSGQEMDFDEFFDFMLIVRQREGFTRAGVNEMRDVFDRFDLEGNGEINALELSHLFRDLGYRKNLDEIRVFLAKVDQNGNNKLDFREYLRLMHLHREDELTKIREVFMSYKDPSTGLIENANLPKALGNFYYAPSSSGGHKLSPGLDFEGFVQVVDSCRSDWIAEERKKAGFSDQRVVYFQMLFAKYDKDHNGVIDPSELFTFLQEFKWQPKNREEQKALMKKVDLSRARAREAGVKDVTPDGAPSIKFWTFLQLARILETEHEQQEEERIAALMVELNFSAKEVDEFRQVFVDKKREAQVRMGAEHEVQGLSRSALVRIVFNLVAISAEKRVQIDRCLERLACTEEAVLDFAGFLRFARWLLDTGWLASKK